MRTSHRPQSSVAVRLVVLGVVVLIASGLSACESPLKEHVEKAEQARAEQVEAALIGGDALKALGYQSSAAPGSEDDITRLAGPTTEVCDRELVIDRLPHVSAGRAWQGDRALVIHAVVGFDGGTAADAVSQIRTAAASCETYVLDTSGQKLEFRIGAPVTLPSYEGVEATFAYCEHQLGVVGQPEEAICHVMLARGDLLSVLEVYWKGPNTAEAFGEVQKLTPLAAEALRGRTATGQPNAG